METRKLLSQLIAIPSVFPEEMQLGKYLHDYLYRLGFNVQYVATGKYRKNIVATIGKSASYIGLYGHMDTVQPDRGYKRDPYRMIVRKQQAFGLGVADMKGGITVILKTAQYASEHELPLKVIFGVDEENISEGAHNLVESGKLADVACMIVGESGQVENYSQAFSVCYGRKGRILFRMNVFGKTAHAAEFHRGINAIDNAVRMVSFLHTMRFPEGGKLGKTLLVVHAISSTTDSFSVPDRCDIEFSLLTAEGVQSDMFRQQVAAWAKRQGIIIELAPVSRKTPYAEWYAVDRRNSFVHTIEKEIFVRYGARPKYTASVADENIFARRLKIPVITIGPLGGGDHTANEWVDLHSLDHAVSAYQDIVRLYSEFERSVER